MQVEVGMYVRTNDGIIGLVNDIDYGNVYEVKISDRERVSQHDIKSASYDIIDIIEVGDYVNGSRVVDIFMSCNDKELETEKEFLVNNDIKSILSREQFEKISYNLKEEQK